MSTILYKRLFEVRILHDYYLSKADLTSYYALDEDDKMEFLNSGIARGRYDIRNVLDIIPSASTRDIFGNYGVRMAPTPSGFIAGAKVKPRLNEAGEEEYVPAIRLSDALQLEFRIKIKNQDFNTFTNLKIRQPAPAHYLFSNGNTGGDKVFPSLSVPVADFQSGRTYEPGELAVVGGALQEALEETSGDAAADWKPVDGDGFANEQDRMLLPKFFPYTVPGASSAAEFTLKKQEGTEVKKITAAGISAFQTLYLDFRQTTSASDSAPEDIDDGRYLLEISTDSSTETVQVYLSDELYRRPDAGALIIETDTTDPDYRVLKNDGTLVTKKKADGTFVPHPVYEIRFRRRSTYWRYRSDSGGTLKATAGTQPFLNEDERNLITKEPRPLTRYPTFFRDPPQPEVYLANPRSNSVKKEKERFFSDLYVSPVKGLIELE